MTALQDIKERLDILAVVEDSGVRLRKVGRAYQGFCPFHDNTRTPAFTVYPETQSFYCFGCQASGTVFDFVMRQRALDFKQALEHLAPLAGVDLAAYRSEQRRERDRQRARLLEITNLAARYYHYVLAQHPRGQAGRDYAALRGLDARTLEAFQVGYALPDWGHLLMYLTQKKGYALDEVAAAGLIAQRRDEEGSYDRFRGRLMFPIRNERGEVVGFGGRAIGDGDPRTPKYLNTPQTPLFDKSRVLYGLELAKDAIRTADNVVVVEGYLDVLTAHQHGFRNVVAPLGTALTAHHVRLLKKHSRTITFALDADAAGQRAVRKGIETAQAGDDDDARAVVSARGLVRWESDVHIRVLRLPAGSDPDDTIRADPQQWRALAEGAVPVMDYYIDYHTEGLDMRHPTNQQEALAALVPLLAWLPDEQQRIYAALLERKLGIRTEHILDMARAGKSASGSQRVAARPVFADPLAQHPATWDETLLALLLRYPAAYGAAERVLERGLEALPQVRALLGVELAALLERVDYRLLVQELRGAGSDGQPPLDETLQDEAARLAGLTLPPDAEQQHAAMAAECARRLRLRQAQQWQARLAEQFDVQEEEPSAEQVAQFGALMRYVAALKAG